MCVKNKTIIYEARASNSKRLRRMISIVACCHDAKLCAHAARAFSIATLRLFLLLQQWSTTISLKGAKSRPTILLVGRTKKIFHNSIDTFCFIALTKPVTQNVRGVTERHCLTKGILSQQRIRHQALTEYIFRLRSRRHQLLFK